MKTHTHNSYLKRALSTLLLFVVFIILSSLSVSAQTETLANLIRQITISGDRQTVAVIYELGSTTIDVFDAHSLELMETIDLGVIPLQIALSPNGERVLWTTSRADVNYYDRTTSTNVNVFPGVPDVIGDIAWNPVTNVVAYSIGIGIDLYDTDTGEWTTAITAPAPAVSRLDWSSDGRYLASSHFNTTSTGHIRAITVWDTSLAGFSQITPIIIDETIGGGFIQLNPSGDRIAVLNPDWIDANNQLLIYDLVANTIEQSISLGENFPNFEWSPDGQFLAVGGANIQIFDTDTWEVVQTISTELPVTSHQWSLDGQQIFHNGGPDGIYVDEVAIDLEAS